MGCLASAGSVVDAASDQLVDARELEPAPVDAGCREDDGRRHLRAVVEDEPHRVALILEAAASDAE